MLISHSFHIITTTRLLIPSLLPTTNLLRRGRLSSSSFKTMASAAQKFPPQTQEKQPGKEHSMDPSPHAASSHYKPANKLHGKVALVTGGDSGIGRSVCYHFALEGATVAFTYVKSEEDKDASDTLEMLKEAKEKRGGGGGHDGEGPMTPISIPADLGFEENCRKVVEEVVKTYGGIDVLVNKAAEQYVTTDLGDIGEEQLERVFRTNIFSYFFLTKYVLKHMKEGGCIINTTSVTAYKGSPKLVDYTATKGAIAAFTRAASLQLAERGIRVNGVAPGPVWTPLIPSSMTEEMVANFGKQTPMRRAGQPQEIAPAYVFLACQDSSYITGQVIHPNGGTIVNA